MVKKILLFLVSWLSYITIYGQSPVACFDEDDNLQREPSLCLLVSGSQIDLFINNNFSVHTPDALIQNSPIADLETGEKIYTNEYNYDGTAAPINFYPNQRALKLAAGGLNPGDVVMTTSLGSAPLGEPFYLKELRVGVYRNDFYHRHLELNNYDTVYIEKLTIPFNAEFVHNGPAPLIITKELHNYGKFTTVNDNLVMEFNINEGKRSVLENKGTFVGRLEYENVRGAAYVPVVYGALFNTATAPTLNDSIAIFLEWAPPEYIDAYEEFQQSGLYDSIPDLIANFTNEVYTLNFNNGFAKKGVPLKGVRLGPFEGDYSVKKLRRLPGNDNAWGKEYFATGEDVNILFSAIENGDAAIVLTSNNIDAPTGDDTLVVTSDGLIANVTEYLLVIDGNTVVFYDSVFYDNASLIVNWNYYYSDFPSVDEYANNNNIAVGDWVNTLDLFPNTYGRQVLGQYFGSFKQNVVLFDLKSSLDEGRKGWEHPDHFIYADTSGIESFFENIYNVSLDSLDYDRSVTEEDLILYENELNAGLIENNIFYDALLESNTILPYPDISKYNGSYNYLNAWGYKWPDVDYDTPFPYPGSYWTNAMWYDYKSPKIESYKGFLWNNSDESYQENLYHPPNLLNSQPLIPNIQPDEYWDNAYHFPLSIGESSTYVYDLDGNLFTEDSYTNCININEDLSYGDDEVFACLNDPSTNSNGSVATPVIFDYNVGIESLDFSSEYIDSVYADVVFNLFIKDQQFNKVSDVLNTTLGYLDLNEVAFKFFEENPNTSFFQVSTWSAAWRGRSVLDPNIVNPYAGKNDNPHIIRKYYNWNYGSNSTNNSSYVITEEQTYWLTILYTIYTATNGAGMSDQAIELAVAFQDGIIAPSDGAPFWYMVTGDFGWNTRMSLGRYVPPGESFYVYTDKSNTGYVTIDSDMSSYTYDLSELDSNEIFSNEVGPWEYTTYGYDYQGSPQRTSEELTDELETNNTSDFSLLLDVASNLISWAYKNDTIYYPFLTLNHSFEDGQQFGANNVEEPAVTTTALPFVFSDPLQFYPTNKMLEDGPHNQDPSIIYFPRPNIGGKWGLEQITKQTLNSRYFDPEVTTYNDPFFNNAEVPVTYTNPNSVRMAIQMFDSTGVEPIIYLNPGQQFILEDDESSAWPKHAYLYHTSLKGDVDGNGVVGSSDLSSVLSALGDCAEDYENGELPVNLDLNDDGCITTQDLLTVISFYGRNIGQSNGQFIGDPISIIWDAEEEQEVDDIFEEEEPYVDDFVQDPGRTSLKLFGNDIIIIDNNLNIVAQGKNSVNIPALDPAKNYLVISDITVGKLNQSLLTGVPAAYDPGTINYNSNNYTAATGSGTIEVYQSMSGATVQDWINLYTNYDYSVANNNSIENVSPRINQLYYGFNSLNTTGDLYSPVNAKVQGLIDMFGAGTPEESINDFSGGVYNDPSWSAATAYENVSGYVNKSIFPPKNIPLAYVSKQVDTYLHKQPVTINAHLELASPVPGGVAQTFGKYSELSSTVDPSVTVWGEDFKEFHDAPLHQGVAAMVDMMSVREYFKLKLHGVSPKFGVNNVPDTRTRFTETHGTSVNYSAVNVLETQQAPAKGWAPNICTNYAEWTTNIVAPFIAANMNQPVTVLNDASPPTQTGIQLNTDADHYQWFENSVMNIALNTYGPLVYDFDWNGVWNQTDLDIWNGITSYWSGLGDDQLVGKYVPACYYRAGTDALNSIVNTLPYVESRKTKYETSKRFKSYFDKDTAPYINHDIANWSECLDGYSYVVGNQVQGSFASSGRFAGIKDLPIFDNNGEILSTLLTQAAPTNLVGAREITDFGSIPAGYLVHPSDNYFPVSNTWQ